MGGRQGYILRGHPGLAVGIVQISDIKFNVSTHDPVIFIVRQNRRINRTIRLLCFTCRNVHGLSVRGTGKSLSRIYKEPLKGVDIGWDAAKGEGSHVERLMDYAFILQVVATPGSDSSSPAEHHTQRSGPLRQMGQMLNRPTSRLHASPASNHHGRSPLRIRLPDPSLKDPYPG